MIFATVLLFWYLLIDLIPLPWIIFPGSTCNQNLDQFSAGILFGAEGEEGSLILSVVSFCDENFVAPTLPLKLLEQFFCILDH